MKQDRVGLVIASILFVTALIICAFASRTEQDDRVKVLEQRMELLKERCDDFQCTVNRVNALEATQQHQQEVLDTIDWAVRYRY